ncbi:MarR family transcriptional regulator [Yersinia massiliensis]|jgi:predicted transcriptional regulator|uniref:MarR family transcriptional regulator n=2 Tax=Yersinia TaxID=629 RepID=A0A2R4NP09_9GAMM|nr:MULTISPECIES: MarR family transcriptional regulator [Yersinia]HEC1648605.1 MarR family transcriptional regulator [Yersinia enterocolitica]AVX37859.1 MarR family transcriptional regulator [Yersinia massiliensis]MDA5546687.1 MarR family transcriptional regulator [Yersinia massiliensis]MDN0126684.1 MarR family transcriptional regulator [Yersinia massiliensis]NIL26265.1 MarR family transcriptional regulator [Yersinia massiliensis]
MDKLVIKTATEADFFTRGKQLAALADAGKVLPAEHTITFEDPLEMVRVLSAARIVLLRMVKMHPGSITSLSTRLKRDRSAVTRDVAVLKKAGLVTVEQKVLPGHGRMKEVKTTAHRLKLEAFI